MEHKTPTNYHNTPYEPTDLTAYVHRQPADQCSIVHHATQCSPLSPQEPKLFEGPHGAALSFITGILRTRTYYMFFYISVFCTSSDAVILISHASSGGWRAPPPRTRTSGANASGLADPRVPRSEVIRRKSSASVKASLLSLVLTEGVRITENGVRRWRPRWRWLFWDVKSHGDLAWRNMKYGY